MFEVEFLDQKNFNGTFIEGATKKIIFLYENPDTSKMTDASTEKANMIYSNSFINKKLEELHGALNSNLENFSKESIATIFDEIVKLDYALYYDIIAMAMQMIVDKGNNERTKFFEILNSIVEDSAQNYIDKEPTTTLNKQESLSEPAEKVNKFKKTTPSSTENIPVEN